MNIQPNIQPQITSTPSVKSTSSPSPTPPTTPQTNIQSTTQPQVQSPPDRPTKQQVGSQEDLAKIQGQIQSTSSTEIAGQALKLQQTSFGESMAGMVGQAQQNVQPQTPDADKNKLHANNTARNQGSGMQAFHGDPENQTRIMGLDAFSSDGGGE